MIFLDELKPMVLYKKPFHLPINEKDKKRGSVSFLLTPSYESSIELLKNPLLVNRKYYESYFIEKDITYFINQEGYLEDISDKPYRNVINESKIFISNKIDNDMILESNSNNLFFLSQDNMNNKTLTPRVPQNFLTKNGYEENETPRVCFSTSVDKCLIALSMNCKDKEFYVHVPVGNYETYTPSVKEVPDRNITGEVWIEKPVKIVCVGKIKVTGDDGKPGKKYTYGDNKSAELYGWNYEWIEKYNVNESVVNEGFFNNKVYYVSDKDNLTKLKCKYELIRVSPELALGYYLESEFGAKKNKNKYVIPEKNKSRFGSATATMYYSKDKYTDKAYSKDYLVYADKTIKLNKIDSDSLEELCKKYNINIDYKDYTDITNKFKKEISNLNSKLGSILSKNDNMKKVFIKPSSSEIREELNGIDNGGNEVILLKWSVYNFNNNPRNMSDDLWDEFNKGFENVLESLNDSLIYKDIFTVYQEGDWDDGFIYLALKSSIKEASNEVLNDPKRLARSLKMRMNKAKYELNRQGDKDRNNVGVEKDSHLNNDKAVAGAVDSDKNIEEPVEEDVYMGSNHKDYVIESDHIRCKVDGQDIILAFNENLDEEVLNESSTSNTMLHKLLYKERFKNNKEIFAIYDKVKADIPWIRKTYLTYDKYREFNLFVDLSHYNQTFFKNNIYKLDKGVDLYFEFINRFINDSRLEKNGYTKKTVFVPVKDWSKEDVKVYKFNDDINPISTIVRLMKTNTTKLLEWKGIEFVFLSNKGYFKVDLSELENSDITKFITFIEKLRKDEPIEDDIQNLESRKAIVANIVDKIEDSQKIKINNLTGEGEEGDKQILINKINQAASTSGDTDEAIDRLEEDDYIKNIIASLAAEEDDSVKINAARSARINKLNDEFLNKKLNGTTIRDMLDTTDNDKELPVTAIKVDTVNEEWDNMQYINFEQNYNIDEDIVAALHSLSTKTVPVMVRDINIEDTSNSEDMIYTYTVNMEDATGNRFTLKFDIPKLKDHKFTRLRGNDKTFNGQLTQIPVSKTDEDTVQVVSNYKKIFISRFGTTTGKSFVVTDRVLKTLRKMESKEIKKTLGNNIRICSKYELPIDYIDMATEYSKLECKNYVFMFNQDDIYAKFGDKIDKSVGIPVGYIEPSKEIMYYNIDKYSTFSMLVYSILRDNSNEFKEIFDTTSTSTRYTYSKASILNNHIPLVVILGYNEGLTKTLKKANVEYELVEKRPKYDKNFRDIIKFNDGYLVYRLNYSSSLLLNGLKQCNTEDFSLAEINSKSMWLEFLDLFGGKILADGLDNFYDMMIDPITEEVLEYYKLPTDYCEILIYANNLLADNKYYRHTDMSARRYRSNEIIAGYAYQALADSYGEYRTNLKRNKKASMTMKQSTVIDRLLLDPTTSDFSILNPLLELEAINSVTYKGLVGMNADRAYSLDKRTFDDSMVNVLGLSTGFAGNVGITRQATMDMNITGKRGYIKVTEDPENMSITKTFTATEALTPFGSRRDDPFRTAMTFVQTAKHGMRVKNAYPSLISNGADQALPYMITNTFAFKAKEDGKIIEKADTHLIVQYKDGTHDFVDLRETVQKNSDGGFYVTLKLDSDLKVGNKIKKGQILAYDKSSFSDKIGHTDDIAYNIGTLAKIAILNTDEGFEDSAIISEWLSDAMASDVVVKKEVILSKNTNIYNMVKKGQPIQEGEPLMIFQNSFDEDDVNLLLKNLADDEELISELGRIPIKSKITGVVEDIKIYRTVEKDELSDSLRKKVNELEKPISDMKKIMKKYDIEYHDRFEADYALDKTGKLKNVEDGVLIDFYLKYEDKLSVGDKIIYYSALKGVIKDIFPKNKEPYTDFRPDEKIHSLLSLGSVNGRMVTSVMINGAISKVLIELDRKVKEMAGIPFKYLDEE